MSGLVCISYLESEENMSQCQVNSSPCQIYLLGFLVFQEYKGRMECDVCLPWRLDDSDEAPAVTQEHHNSV